ncbi:hypothetical protein ACC691_36965, partial [Rhizobium johnstonii]|uniref:hypothetical protein n=1 Tax=Rhizobium johnstonii TaxID=3019933 RepID=UPI003F9CB1C9
LIAQLAEAQGAFDSAQAGMLAAHDALDAARLAVDDAEGTDGYVDALDAEADAETAATQAGERYERAMSALSSIQSEVGDVQGDSDFAKDKSDTAAALAALQMADSQAANLFASTALSNVP